MLGAAVPPPQVVSDFTKCIKEVSTSKAKPLVGDLFDSVFEKQVTPLENPKVQKLYTRRLSDWSSILKHCSAKGGVELEDLDAWFEQLSKFVINVRTVTPNEQQQKRILKKH